MPASARLSTPSQLTRTCGARRSVRLALCLASLLLLPKRSPADEGHGWDFEASLRTGSQYGELRNRDETFYKDIALGAFKADSSFEAVDPKLTTFGIDLTVHRLLGPSTAVGVQIGYLRCISELDNPGFKQMNPDYLRQLTVAMNARWTPFHYDKKSRTRVLFELEPALGIAFGTIQRYGLAANANQDSLTAKYVQYIRTANKELSAIGPYASLSSFVTFLRPSGFRCGFGGGLTYANWNLMDDPLSTWTYKNERYPSSIGDIGVHFRAKIGFGD